MRALGVLLLTVACATPESSKGAPPPPVSSSRAAPDFELRTVDGEAVQLRSSAGSVAVLAFWATWCEPCKTELPQLEKLHQKYHAKGLRIIGVSMDDSTTVSQVAPYVKRMNFTFPIVLDTEGQVANLYNSNKAAPFTVIIGRSGTIAQERMGYEPGEERLIEQIVVDLLNAT